MYTGCQRIPQRITKLIVWAILVSIGHVTMIKVSSFGAETWLITQNLKWEKGCVIEKLSSPSSKENGSIVISKDNCGKLSWDHTLCLFWISFTMVTLSAGCLQRPFFAKVFSYFAKVLFFCMTVPGVVHPTGQLFMAVNLIGYGSVPILQSVFYLSLNPWEAPGWQVIAIDADVKQVITSWQQSTTVPYPGI